MICFRECWLLKPILIPSPRPGLNNKHSIKDILEESLEHELHALSLYNDLLREVENKSVFIEEFARNKIGQEEQHSLELKKMLKDYS